tara:strand:- start:3280 stop:3810 length:531 start_codon:yes stop_codon:yes gene_type:complete
MSVEFVHEKLAIHTEYHPYFKSINQGILQDLSSFNFERDQTMRGGRKSNVRGWKSRDEHHSKGVKLIDEWVVSCIKNTYWGMSIGLEWKSGIESWVVKYDKGDYTHEHDHIPAMFSFVYFIKCPKGSSPLVFTKSGKKIKAEEGKIVIFPGWLRHHVPKNKCEDRITMAGNIFYRQ